ncbi:MAG: nicotinate (nicotinamide) nucleotide adenylyltransferase [Phycisphaerales bacterium]|nr:nicotinate (nicotinamide) nucleotide adenylyltransferase [Phycisphaerales bacterium]
MLELTPGGPVVIFGGSFDPPTHAHALLPRLAAQVLGASRLVYVPAAISPHKSATPPAPADDRIAMLKLALTDCPQAEIDLREIERGGNSYSFDTLRDFREELPSEIALRLLIGTDQAVVFHRWHRWRDILEIAQPAVLIRDGDDPEATLSSIADAQGADLAETWRNWLLDLPLMSEASTTAREAVACGREPLDDVPNQIAQYIKDHGLYRSTGAPSHVD